MSKCTASKYFSNSEVGILKPRKSVMNRNEQNGMKKGNEESHNKTKRRRAVEDINAELVLASSLKTDVGTPKFGLNRVKDCFFDVCCEDLAKGLLGQILVRRLEDGTVMKGRIIETECYLGGEDKASHSYNGRITVRNKPMYMKPGTAYVYLTYGMYHCFNISSRGPGAAVLLRAVEPLEGLEYMQQERGRKLKSALTKRTKDLKPHELCNGPAKLCMSFSITKESSNEKDLTVWDGMWIEKVDTREYSQNWQIVTSHRIGIDSVGIEWAAKPLRFYILGNSSVSKRDKAKELQLKAMCT